MRHLRRLGWLLGVGVGLCGPALIVEPARAQTAAEVDAARQLFRDALALEATGNWGAALAKLEQVARVKLTPQVRFHIARCKDHLGRLAEALGDYRVAEFDARAASAPELEQIASALEELEARVPRVTITLAKGLHRARIELDGVAFASANLGTALPVDAGAHQLKVTLPDGRSWEQSFTAAEGEGVELELSPKAGEVSPVAGAPRREKGEGAPDVAPPADADRPPPTKDGGGGSALPWVIGGVGAAGLVAAGVFALLHQSAESDLQAVCRGSSCPESSRSRQDDSKTYGTLTGVSLAVGALGVGVGVALLLSGGSKDAGDAHAVRAELRVGSAFQGVSLGGHF